MNNYSALSILISLSIGAMIAYFAFSMQKISTQFIMKPASQKKHILIFFGVYMARFIIYGILIFLALRYLSANPIFVIISFTVTIAFLIWRFHKKIQMLKKRETTTSDSSKNNSE